MEVTYLLLSRGLWVRIMLICTMQNAAGAYCVIIIICIRTSCIHLWDANECYIIGIGKQRGREPAERGSYKLPGASSSILFHPTI